MRPKYLTERDGIWHFARRVPRAYEELDKRGVIKHSTGVAVASDPRGTRAKAVRDVLNSDLEAAWRQLAAGGTLDIAQRGEATRKRARALGLAYLPASEVAELPLDQLLARVEVLKARDATRDEISRDAAFGIAADPVKPAIPLSKLFATYEDAVRTDIRDYSPAQLRRWSNAKTRAVNNLIATIGDRDIAAISRADALEYRAWWAERILEEGLDPDTANKDLGHLARILRTVDRLHQLRLPPVFADLRFEGGFENSRVPYPRDFVQGTILAPGRLMTLNDEARRVVFLMAGSGLRIAECVNLNAATIHLDADIPHVQVRPDGRRLKTDESLRDMPLVGVALAAMRYQPKGFPRYHDDGAGLSATVNAYLADNGLRPKAGQSLYSLRHTFKDSLIAVEAPDSIIDHLMGHATEGPKYGVGPPLQLKLKWVHAVAFAAPEVV